MLGEIFVLIFIGVFIGISQSAGIGGGTIVNVLLIIGLGYNAKDSVIITYIFLMGGGLASTIASFKKKTEEGKNIIDYDLVMITLPMMMSGAIFGTILNHFISQMLITLIFIALLIYMTYTTYGKYQQAKNASNAQPLIKNNNKSMQMQLQQSIGSSQQAERLQEIISQETTIFPMDKVKIIAQIYLYTLIILLCRGGKTFDSLIGLEKCSYGSWIFAFLHLFLSYLYSKSIAIKQFQRQLQKQSLGFTFQDASEKMSEKKMRDGIINGFFAGLLGACISIGGGMVLLPLWFKAGVDKSIAISSTGPLIFFSASISFFISALLGKYESFWLVVIFFAVSFTGSYLVKNLVFYLVEKYKFKSLVIIMLLFMMVLSLVVFLPVQYAKYRSDPVSFMQFDILC